MIYDPDHLMGEGECRGHTLVAVNDAALVTDVSEFSYRELLVPQVRNGAAASPREDIEVARARCASALESLDDATSVFCIHSRTWWAWRRASPPCATSSFASAWLPRPPFSPGRQSDDCT